MNTYFTHTYIWKYVNFTSSNERNANLKIIYESFLHY